MLVVCGLWFKVGKGLTGEIEVGCFGQPCCGFIGLGRGLGKEAMELLSPRGIGLIGPSIPRCGYSHGAHSEPVELFNLGLFRANVPHLRPSTRSY